MNTYNKMLFYDMPIKKILMTSKMLSNKCSFKKMLNTTTMQIQAFIFLFQQKQLQKFVPHACFGSRTRGTFCLATHIKLMWLTLTGIQQNVLITENMLIPPLPCIRCIRHRIIFFIALKTHNHARPKSSKGTNSHMQHVWEEIPKSYACGNFCEGVQVLRQIDNYHISEEDCRTLLLPSSFLTVLPQPRK